jgi:hypothetical protein
MPVIIRIEFIGRQVPAGRIYGNQLRDRMKKSKKHKTDGESTANFPERQFREKAERVIADTLKIDNYRFEKEYNTGVDNALYEPLYVDFFVRDIAGFPEGLSIDIAVWELPLNYSNDSTMNLIIANIKERYPFPAILIVPDSGYLLKPRHIDFLKKNIDGRKLLGVYTLDEFVLWWQRHGPERTGKK